MPQEYDNRNSGMLYRNVDKREDKHPDYRGFLEQVVCPHCQQQIEFYLSAWLREAKRDSKVLQAGQKFFSLLVTAKEGDRKPAQNQGGQEAASDVPF